MYSKLTNITKVKIECFFLPFIAKNKHSFGNKIGSLNDIEVLFTPVKTTLRLCAVARRF
jgi:hypothetical protein